MGKGEKEKEVKRSERSGDNQNDGLILTNWASLCLSKPTGTGEEKRK
jgi:hypothetical protein